MTGTRAEIRARTFREAFEAVHPRQVDIQKDQHDALAVLFEQGQRLGSIAGLNRVIPFSKHVPKNSPVVLNIVQNEQHGRTCAHRQPLLRKTRPSLSGVRRTAARGPGTRALLSYVYYH
jgi:hypothetical protein